MKTKIFFTVMALSAVTLIAEAQVTEVDKNQQNLPAKGFAYVDTNNNGICDNFENGVPNRPCGRGYGYGRFYASRAQGQATGQVQDQVQPDIKVQDQAGIQGRRFGPGQGGRWRNGAGWGPGQGFRRGMGPGRGRNLNFVDADKNGICDYYDSATKK